MFHYLVASPQSRVGGGIEFGCEMKFTGLLRAALALGGSVLALHLHPPAENAGKTLSFGFEKVKRNVDNIPRLRKRASPSTVRQLLDNLVGYLLFQMT